MKKIAVIGSGTWGIALARVLANKKYEINVWSSGAEKAEQLSQSRVHPNLPGMTIPESVYISNNMERVCRDRDIIILATASVHIRSVTGTLSSYISQGQKIVVVAKGIEKESGMSMTEVVKDELSRRGVSDARTAALSGPTHAEEVALDMPTAILAASTDPELACELQELFSGTCMRVYTSTDVKGVELCGALKNVIALAAGISDGLGYGDNAKAALITRGMAEIARLGSAMGCPLSSFYGLAGIGDLIVTATSRHSRNNRAGYLIGSGYSAEEAVKQVGMVVEGLNALPAAVRLAEIHKVEMPIVSSLDGIINHGANVRESVDRLMSRSMKAESIS